MSDLLKAMENQVMRNQLLELFQEAGPNGANEKVIAMAMKKAGYPVQPEQLNANSATLKEISTSMNGINRSMDGINRTVENVLGRMEKMESKIATMME